MRRVVGFTLGFAGFLLLAGCGGGNSGSGVTSPTITSVSPSCTPNSVAVQGTATCTAAVSGTGSYSSSVTWSASAGSITSAGVFTAPSSAATVTITATSTQDTTKSGTTSITVSASASGISVTISPTSASVASGGTEQFTATVTGGSNTAVTWTTSAGTISTSGLLSLVGVAAGTNVTVTATSVADTTKSASATVSVTQRVITISTAHQVISDFNLGVGAVVGASIYATGIEVGDVITGTQFGKSSTITVDSTMVTAGGFTLNLSFSTQYFMPNWAEITVASADGTSQSNELWVAITSDQNALALSSNGSLVYLAAGLPFQIQEYSTVDGTNKGALSNSTANNYSIATDNQTGDIFADENGQNLLVYTSSGLPGSLAATGLMAVTAQSGYGYVTQPSAGKIGQCNISQGCTALTSVSAGNQPWTMDAATVNSSDAVVVYSKQDTALQLFNNQLVQDSHLTLAGVTQASAVATATLNVGGGWMVQMLGSGPAAGTGAFLSVYDKSLVFWNVDSTNTLHVDHQSTLTGTPILIAKDETHGAVIVASVDLTKGVTTMQSFDMKTFTATSLTSPSTLPVGFMPGGILVSTDGTKIYVGGTLNGQPGFYLLNNQ